LTQADNAKEGSTKYISSLLSRMRTDRETQGKQRDLGKDKGPWGGEFLFNFGQR